MNTLAPFVWLSEQPSPFIHPRRTSSAFVHFGPFFTAQAEGQHTDLTSLEKHIGEASSPNSNATVSVIIVTSFVVAPVVFDHTSLA
jgi:hypothetical protein